jgi:hypothetical protein
MDRIERLYPGGSKWTYLGTPCVISRLHDYDGCPTPCVHDVDHDGLFRETSVAVRALKPASGEEG